VNSVRFHDEARLELIAQVGYYEAAREGLGDAFNSEVEAIVEVVARNPDSGLQYNFGTLRKVLKRFPFSVVYVVLPAEVVILAIAHFRKRPGYWRDRSVNPETP
jgi:plasmid stabilization system protein ParE